MSSESRRDNSLAGSEFEAERSEFIETFFRKGAEFASSLLTELKTLKQDSERLRLENAELRHHLASEEAIRELLEKIDKLEQEKDRLRRHVQDHEAQNVDYVERYEEVERELDTMANLYVALSQLHSTFEPKEMLGVIEQMLAQFIGAGSFVIYLRRGEGDEKVLSPVHAYHCSAAGEAIAWGEGPVGECAATQLRFVADSGVSASGEPLACIPMVLEKETVGVIALLSFFEQKSQFEDIDFEFFKLLATHSASAIVAAGLMAEADSLGDGLEPYERLY